MPLTLTLIRHAPTRANLERRYVGHGDPDLCEDGEADARALGRKIAGAVGPPMRGRHVWSSDLVRARRTAELAFPGIEVHVDRRLREIDFGDFEGGTYLDNLERHGDRFRRWIDDPVAHPAPNGETIAALAERVIAWLADLPDEGSVVAVTHGGPLRVLASALWGIPLDRTLRWSPPPLSMVRATLAGSPILPTRLLPTPLLPNPLLPNPPMPNPPMPDPPMPNPPMPNPPTTNRPTSNRPMTNLPAELSSLLSGVRPPDRASPEEVRDHLDSLTKPPGSLGRLERLAERLTAITGDPPPPLTARVVFVLAGDHGVAVRGVSAYPREVTAQMCRNLASGGAAINVLARATGCEVVVADFGVDARPEEIPEVTPCKVRRGTSDLTAGPAMEEDEALAAVLRGAALLEERRPVPDVVALGEMGIGNTTAASVITAALTGAPVDDVIGPGTGVEGSRLERKRDAVLAAVRRMGDRHPLDPLRILREAGGFEIAGLVGVTLAAARARIPVVVDGFIATSAAALAAALAPAAEEYLFAGHLSPEPGHRLLLDRLGLEPVLDLGLRLGEGTGAVLAIPILDSAGAILREMATFASAGISGPDSATGADAATGADPVTGAVPPTDGAAP